MSFKQSLAAGLVGESHIARWMRARGYNVLPVYEIEQNQFKGPTLLTSDNRELIATDMLVFNGNKAFWIEAKHKTAFSWHRKTRRWVTGIDLRHYRDYCRVAALSSWPVWLLFLHAGGQAKDSPTDSPSGLYGNDIQTLAKNENHRHDNWGRSGMVYWARKQDGGALLKIAALEEVTSENWKQLGDVAFELVAKAALKQAQKAEVPSEQDH